MSQSVCCVTKLEEVSAVPYLHILLGFHVVISMFIAVINLNVMLFFHTLKYCVNCALKTWKSTPLGSDSLKYIEEEGISVWREKK